MNETEIIEYITSTFEGVHVVDAWGDLFFYYNPQPAEPDEFYFATLKSKDDEYDNFSNLDRPSTFRLNIGIGKETFLHLFGAKPARRDERETVGDQYDYTLLDQVLPHPVYGRQNWVCVLNPSPATFHSIQPLLVEAYQLAADRHTKRAAKR